jgi:hypothetical protein
VLNAIAVPRVPAIVPESVTVLLNVPLNASPVPPTMVPALVTVAAPPCE